MRSGTTTGTVWFVGTLLEGKLLAAPDIKTKIEGSSIMLSGRFPDAMRRLVETINGGRPASAPER